MLIYPEYKQFKKPYFMLILPYFNYFQFLISIYLCTKKSPLNSFKMRFRYILNKFIQ